MSYRSCTRCLMDSVAPEIKFEKGICNFCKQAKKALYEIEQEKKNLPLWIERIKKDGEGKKYDCLIGLSGGVDSSYTLHRTVRLGLRPLCFSVDNGYNNPKADENIMKLVETLKVPFFRYTINLDRFKELQAAFIKAGQKNIEIPTDHILLATTYEMASKYKIKWILSGGNVATESIMPESWGYNARDLVHIKDIYKKMIGKKLKGLPVCGLMRWNYYRWVKRIRMFYPLDYLDYNRANAVKELEELYGWKDYYNKHEENYFTQWFQNFYLFEKFGIDKRKAHLSSLIISDQMTREEAIEEVLKQPIYPKFGIEQAVLAYPKRPYTDFKTDEKRYKFICNLIRKLPKSWRY